MKIPIPNFHIQEADDKLSCRDFTNWSFNPREGYDFNNKVVYSSVFAQTEPDTQIFPTDVHDLTLVNCNTDNVAEHSGVTIIMEGGGRRVRQQVQNDGNHWEIDAQNKPTRPTDHKFYTKRGLPMPKPQDIPTEKVENRIDLHEVAVQLAVANNVDPE